MVARRGTSFVTGLGDRRDASPIDGKEKRVGDRRG